MTRIRATCPTCGEVDLRPVDIRLELVEDLDGQITDGSSYRFTCPTCSDEVVKAADDRIARLLTTGGVEIAAVRTARGMAPHPESPPDGPALTYDDLLDLHELLESGHWFDELEALTL